PGGNAGTGGRTGAGNPRTGQCPGQQRSPERPADQPVRRQLIDKWKSITGWPMSASVEKEASRPLFYYLRDLLRHKKPAQNPAACCPLLPARGSAQQRIAARYTTGSAPAARHSVLPAITARTTAAALCHSGGATRAVAQSYLHASADIPAGIPLPASHVAAAPASGRPATTTHPYPPHPADAVNSLSPRACHTGPEQSPTVGYAGNLWYTAPPLPLPSV